MLAFTYFGRLGDALDDARRKTKYCAESPHDRDCAMTMMNLVNVAPDRDILIKLGQILLSPHIDGFWGYNSMDIPANNLVAHRHHAAADRDLAASHLARVLADKPPKYEYWFTDVIDALVENLSENTPADIRARAILVLTGLSDLNPPDNDAAWIYVLHAREALEKVAHLTIAPEPPVEPPPEPLEPVEPLVWKPIKKPAVPKGVVIAGVVGALALVGVATVMTLQTP